MFSKHQYNNRKTMLLLVLFPLFILLIFGFILVDNNKLKTNCHTIKKHQEEIVSESKKGNKH
jgi:hypothetical protein